jgi:putative GTP pyrophosphokinase
MNNIRIGHTEEYILNELSERISKRLGEVGLFFRIFTRIKSKKSIDNKIQAKHDEYKNNGKRMQDVFGIRVTLYFSDDEAIAINIVKEEFEEIVESRSIDIPEKERFGPTRNNFVFTIPTELADNSSLFDHHFIDRTFEVQFRSVFSEGWHEVEHDFRYKCRNDWEKNSELSRQLNGQFATLESCNWAILKIFDELAYSKYKSKEWSSFFRNTLRIRFEDHELTDPIKFFLDNNPFFAKNFLRIDRKALVSALTKKGNLPLKMDNVFYILNRDFIGNKEVEKMEPVFLKEFLSTIYNR